MHNEHETVDNKNCQIDDIPYRLFNWSLLWSPLQSDDSLVGAWESLALCGHWSESSERFIRTFLMDLPQPKIPLLFSALLQRESGACREEWMRIAHYLDMRRVGASLPPDHLALACEIMAHAWVRREDVLMAGMLSRYLLPWLECALDRCEEPLRSEVLIPFQGDIIALLSAAPWLPDNGKSPAHISGTP